MEVTWRQLFRSIRLSKPIYPSKFFACSCIVGIQTPGPFSVRVIEAPQSNWIVFTVLSHAGRLSGCLLCQTTTRSQRPQLLVAAFVHIHSPSGIAEKHTANMHSFRRQLTNIWIRIYPFESPAHAYQSLSAVCFGNNSRSDNLQVLCMILDGLLPHHLDSHHHPSTRHPPRLQDITIPPTPDRRGMWEKFIFLLFPRSMRSA